VTGEGSQTRDFIFSGDVARFLRMGLEEPVRGQLVNLGRGVQTSIRDAIAVMGEVVGVDPRVEHRDPRPDEIDDFYADMSRCEQLFGEVPATGLRAGVERTYEWLAPRLED
jgi:UDP-glucose 4-epimerase